MNAPVDLPLGEELNWKPVPRPTSMSLRGSHILVRPVNAVSDAVPLFSVSHSPDGDPAIWAYLPDGPYESPDHLRHETVDDAADRILREHLPVIREANSTLATLGRLAQLRAQMKPGKGAVRIVQEGRPELDGASLEHERTHRVRDTQPVYVTPRFAASRPGPMT